YKELATIARPMSSSVIRDRKWAWMTDTPAIRASVFRYVFGASSRNRSRHSRSVFPPGKASHPACWILRRSPRIGPIRLRTSFGEIPTSNRAACSSAARPKRSRSPTSVSQAPSVASPRPDSVPSIRFANGVGSVADRIGSGPDVYIRGPELLASEIDVDRLSVIPGDFLALRAHTGELEINNESLPIVVVALVNYLAGNATNSFPVGARDLSLDAGLRERIQEMSERPVETAANLSLFGIRLTGLPVVPPPPSRSPLFPDTWARVRADLLAGMDLVHGGSVQAIVTNATLDPSMVSRLGLTRMDAIGAVGFVRAGVAQIQATLQLLALVIGLVIALLVYAAMSLEVHARAREIATLRSLGATPAKVGALPGEPVRIVAGDAYAITQGTGPLSINVSLASNITASGWAKTVSPEILGLTTLAGNPVVVRAVDPDAFLRLENATHLSGAMD